MLTITAVMLNTIAPGGNQTVITGLVPFLNKYCDAYGINTVTRLKHFLGQAAEESASFRTLTEYASGAEYEGRSDLGNTHSGDGVRYKGRGIFQITGRANYQAIGTKLGIDLVNNPTLAATPEVAVETACIYWQSHNLSAIADGPASAYDTCVAITKKINGGTNGLAERWTFTQRALVQLSAVTTTVTPSPAVPAVSVPPITGPAVFPAPVTKTVEVATKASVDAAAVNAADNSNPFLYAVSSVATFVKKFF